MNLHPQKLIIFLATLAVTPGLYPSQALPRTSIFTDSAEYHEQAGSSSALSSASSSSVGTNAPNSGATSSISSDTSLPTNTPSKNAGQELYALGDSCQKTSPQKAIAFYQLAGKLGNADALNKLGVMFWDGINVTKDLDRARYYLLEAAAQNHPYALYNLGILYQEGKDVKKDIGQALIYLELAANLGHVPALNLLSVMFFDGVDVTQDFDRAYKYTLQAAEQNNPTALFNLGIMHQQGNGVTEDIKRAVDYYQKAAEKGSVEAQYLLGKLYRKGEKIERNWELSLKYYHQAAQQGHADSQFELGQLYLFGLGVRKNLPKAFKWILAAAANEDQIYPQAFMYPFLQSGISIQQDIKKAAEFFEKIKRSTGSEAATRKLIVEKCQKNYLPEPKFPAPHRCQECSICKETFELNDEVALLPCDHCFCKPCITPWLLQSKSCPYCRANTTPEDVVTGIALAQE